MAFSGNTSALIFDAIVHKAPTSPVRINPELPAELEYVINKALEKDRALRYQLAGEMLADLKRRRRNSSSTRVEAVVDDRKPAKRRNLLWTSATAAALINYCDDGSFRLARPDQWQTADFLSRRASLR